MAWRHRVKGKNNKSRDGSVQDRSEPLLFETLEPRVLLDADPMGLASAALLSNSLTEPVAQVAEIATTSWTGTAGDDSFAVTGSGDWTLSGLAGKDRLSGKQGNDKLDGGLGKDWLSGGAGDDTIILRGSEGAADSILAGQGTRDTLKVDGASALTRTGFDAQKAGIEIWAGNGTVLNGTASANRFNLSAFSSVSGLAGVSGHAGNDVLIGSRFSDDLRGDEGNDSLAGGAGDDILNGGTGGDRLEGGVGTDTAVYTGNLGDYEIRTNASGERTVRHLRTGDLDTLIGVERLQFAGGASGTPGKVNSAPTAIKDVSATPNLVSEGATAGTTVGLTAHAIDPDTGDSYRYSLVSNAGGRFAIHNSTGAVSVANGSLLDYETATSHAIRVRATDAGGLWTEQDFVIAIRDVPAPEVTPKPEAPASPPAPSVSEPAGLYVTGDQLERAKDRILDKEQPFAVSGQALLARANSALKLFHMENPVRDMMYGWTTTSPGYGDGIDNTLRELVDAASNDMATAASAAYKWLLLGDAAAGARAVSILETWNSECTIPNMEDFGIDYRHRTFVGKTSDGFSGVRPGNFALDMGWMHYGLRGASAAYLALKQNGYPLTDAQEENIESLIRKMTQSVVSSLNAWTEWARLNPTHKEYNRIASDNHIPEYLGGLAAAAAALGGAEGNSIFEYVVNGTAHDFGNGLNLPNYIPLKRYIDNGLIHEPGTTRVVYDDWNWKQNPRTYHGAVQMSLGTIERVLQLYYPKEAGFYTNYRTPDGLTVMQAAETYARYILGQIPGGSQDTRPKQYAGQLALELAYTITKDPAQKRLFEAAIYTQVDSAKDVRTQYFKSYGDLAVVLIGENIRE